MRVITDLQKTIDHYKIKAKEARRRAEKFKKLKNEPVQGYAKFLEQERISNTEARNHEQLASWLEELKQRREADRWIKITYRPMTKEEEIAYKREFGIDYGDTLLEYENKVFTCELPNDKQDILIQTNWGVKQDTCDWSDGYCGLEGNGDWDGVIAWRPTPEYKESEAENED